MSYRRIHEETIYQGRVFDLVRLKFQLPDQKEYTYELVKHHGAVVIIPVDQQGNILFVRQFRIGAEDFLLELPAGLLEEGETPETSAAREVQEETGMAAARLEKLGDFFMVPGYSTEKMTAYLATGLRDSVLPKDEDEFLELVSIPIREAYQMARRGEIRDGKTLASLFLGHTRLSQLAGANNL